MALYSEILKKYWGFSDFRGIQREIIESIGSGRDTLGLMPTGGGKSITFQVPTLSKEGLCLVITPLIALMKDQVANLRSKGIKAAAIYSGMKQSDIILILENCIFGDYKFLYISPERLSSELFLKKVRHIPVTLLTVDEAHCISQWGHDFRPSYRTISQIRELFPNVPVLALTATATTDVVNDIQKQLKFKEINIFKMSFERKNISYIIRNTENKSRELLHILNKIEGSTIIYTPNRKKTKEVADILLTEGISAEYYHAGLSSNAKDEREERWKKNISRVMVCTNAFGMGIDKPDVRMVIHTDMPSSIEAYFQEAGRAGRDGEKAWAVALYNNSDKRIISKRVSDNYPPPEFIRNIYDHICYFYEMALGDGINCTFDFSLMEFCQTYHFSTLQTDSALRLLTRMGYLEYVEEMEFASRIQFIVQREELYKLRSSDEEIELLITTILRNYSGVFTNYTYVDEKLLNKITKISRHRIYQILTTLAQRRILIYTPTKKTPLLTFARHRVLGKELRFEKEIYEERKIAFTEKIKSILDYATRKDECRSRLLLSYFGQKEPPLCDVCDICLSNKSVNISSKEINAYKNKILEMLDDGNPHKLNIIEKLNLSKLKNEILLRHLMDEEIVIVKHGMIIKNS